MESFQSSPANLATSRNSKSDAVAAGRGSSFWLVMVLAAAAWLAPLLWLHAQNTRLLPSWHGFLHAGIATSFDRNSTLSPENPFFAGEKLRYYWFYDFLGYAVGRVLHTDVLHAFQFITLASLIVLIVFAGLIGRKYFRSTAVGLLIGYFALVGLNPLGPVIATGKHLLRGAPLLSPVSETQQSVEQLSVSDQLADQWMTHPLLSAMQISGDWRHGQNVVWFLDISSRAPALALIMVLLFLLLGTRASIGTGMGVCVVTALMVALNPVLGLAVSVTLAIVSLVLFAVKLGEDPGTIPASGKRDAFLFPLASFAGIVLALPTFYHLLSIEGTASLSSPSQALIKLAALSANFLLLVPLALWGVAKAPAQRRYRLWSIAASGFLLLLVVPLIHLQEGNEHNVTNAAQGLLAVPALAWAGNALKLKGRQLKESTLCLVLFALFLPAAVATLFSFTGRPDLPLQFHGQNLVRLPEKSPLAELYDWTKKQTPADAVFICNPDEPVKMSGNVAELPAFTARALFTDQESYLNSPYKDAAVRARIARDVASGHDLAAHQLNYLYHLQRPLYVVTYHADDKELLGRLIQRHGEPVFHESYVAVVKFAMPATEPSEFELTFSTYLGGSQLDSIRDVTTDSHGNVYVTGGTVSPDFPVTPGAYQTKHNPGSPDSRGIDRFDVFVTKLDPSGKLVWSTFLGGPNYDRAYAIKVDAQGYVYVAGRAGRGFPVTAGSFQPTFMGGQEADFYGPQDGFIAKLAPDGSTLVWASYFGTSDPRIIRDLALDQTGNIYIASGRNAGDYPQAVQSAFNNRPRGDQDAVFAKIKSDGTQVLWATYLGGSDWESNQNSIRLDAAGNPYVLFTTKSTDIATNANAYDRTYAGDEDLYVAKLTPDKGNFVWGTYLGGSKNESTETHEFAVDAAGNCYVAAPTTSPDFPTTPGAFQRRFGGGNDTFVAKISADGTRLVASTLVGGSGNDRPEGMAVDKDGNVCFTGTTTSADFPATTDATQTKLRGNRDAMVVKLAADFSQLLYASYLGGAGEEYGRGATLDAAGNFYFGGESDSSNWPVRNAAQASYGGAGDAILTKFTLSGRTSTYSR